MNVVPHHQRGVSLFVVLLLLLIVTLLGLSSLRSTVMEERMSANMFDRSLGFQGAESALRESEANVALLATRESFPASGCTNGLCATPDGSATERWFDSGFTGWQNASVATAPAATGAPQVFAEAMGMGSNWSGCERVEPLDPLCESPRYRVTSRSGAEGTDRAQVILQSYVSTP
jgi:type IV pilus assembly protein PilX